MSNSCGVEYRVFISPDFTRVVLYRKGRGVYDRRLLDDEHICALDTFIENGSRNGATP
ncbi:hypothetical protein KCP75_03570 [Salmonella enterica subsp. enterica]|nr:hypothetical protein KCP75_03570 [Salmonella enterica subsp. enterica]